MAGSGVWGPLPGHCLEGSPPGKGFSPISKHCSPLRPCSLEGHPPDVTLWTVQLCPPKTCAGGIEGETLGAP
jgi:hypothetical protein